MAVKTKIKNQQEKTIWKVITLGILSFSLLGSFYYYLINWKEDQSIVSLSDFWNRNLIANNLWGKIGAFIGHIFIYKGIGVASFIFVFFLFAYTWQLITRRKKNMLNMLCKLTLIAIYISVFLGYFYKEGSVYSGIIGFEVSDFLQVYLGKFGLGVLLLGILLVYLIVKFNITFSKVGKVFSYFELKWQIVYSKIKQCRSWKKYTSVPSDNQNLVEKIQEQKKDNISESVEFFSTIEQMEIINNNQETISEEKSNEIGLDIEPDKEENSVEVAQRLVENFGEYDPTLELNNFQFPPLELLKESKDAAVVRDYNELEENKNTIIQTLGHYKIDVKKITATIGPTVTLYEIVPGDGVRLNKIKSLEDDIALSLEALGIRIIAPIPGKGTVGIEVPNKKTSIVSMRSVIGSERFQSAQMELPIAFGKTITNETYVVDLTKMPHLLMAGATGQGKSVGLNAVIASLLYRKHPAEVKFVLVDPKKVELTLYNKIERHYLAKLPDSEEAIITDNTKVINTLNSLCIEMDNRYDLLRKAMVRNIKEYNQRFKIRQLNPNDGHKFLPYIVLVVDEFADLIMTAGKEVELPISRLAQLARAVGIHLIIATQRPSVNVITGVIKANFPARVAFRVTSKIDSKTILDGSGADRLIGRGDMLYTQGNDMVRIQCAFIDTPEVEKIVDFVSAQKAYPDAYLLPEYVGDSSTNDPLDVDLSKKDALFKEAAEIVVSMQQGSASTLQRKLNIGFARAGRIIDQLEASGIVGPFEGSKPRKVLIPDLIALDSFFANEKK